jgi:hypothetical protein
MAEVVFWAAWLARRSTEDAARAMKFDQSRLAFAEWFAFDYEHPGGRTLVESLLQREGDRLRTGERRYLERMRLSQIRPYEVTRVRPEEGLDLRDLWTRKIVRVRERLATRDVVQWDLVVTRVVLGPDGVPIIEGRLELLPATEAEPVLKRLRREHREFKRRVPEADLVTFFKRLGMVYHHVWLDAVALRPLPTVVTAEGDAIVIAKVIFDVVDGPALSAALARHPDLVEQDDGSYAWLETARATRSRVQPPARRGIMITSETWRPGSDDVRRGVGTFVLARGRIVFETMSKARAERGRRLLDEIAGAAVKFRAIRYETMASAMERGRARTPKAPPVPPEVEAQLVGELYERHYRAWPDQPLPALGGRTPREAARLPSARPGLVSLLKQLEVMAARQRCGGRPAYDFGWLWGELGLERPG